MWTTYTQPTGSITDSLNRLRLHTHEVPTRLLAFSEVELTRHVPGNWSRKEILGHLIDSAINNLKRFTDAQFNSKSYVIQPYDQNKLVTVNLYQNLPLTHLLALWSSLNTQICFVATGIPSEMLTKPVQFADPSAPSQTLSWLIEDYVAHLEHHLKTLL